MLAPNSRLCLESAIAKLSFPSPLSVHITSVKSSARPHARKGRSDNTATKPPTLPNSYFAPVLEFNLSLPPPPPLQSNITTTHAHLELADYRTDLSDLPAVTTLSTRNDRWPPPSPPFRIRSQSTALRAGYSRLGACLVDVRYTWCKHPTALALARSNCAFLELSSTGLVVECRSVSEDPSPRANSPPDYCPSTSLPRRNLRQKRNKRARIFSPSLGLTSISNFLLA
jgi:hypothetical protein